MLQLSHSYSSDESLYRFIEEHLLESYKGIIQIFSGVSLETVKNVQQELKCRLPLFTLIGASTAGEIINGKNYDDKLVISFLIFEKNTFAKPFSTSLSLDKKTQATLKLIAQEKPKAVIFFANPLDGSPDEVLDSFHKQLPNCVIAGGNAADNIEFVGTYTLIEEKAYQQGLVGVAIYGDDIQACQYRTTGWQPIGQSFKVTHAKSNILYELDDKPILEIYKKYLGEHITEDFPNAVIEFPLMIRKGEQSILRAPVGMTHDKKGVILAGDIVNGDTVTFSFADGQSLVNLTKNLKHITDTAVFIYSCAARKIYLNEHIQNEIFKLGDRNDATGAFFYGEYCSLANELSVLNLSTTLLFLSEKKPLIELEFENHQSKICTPNALNTLAHLAATTGKELNDAFSFLEQHQYAVDQSSIVSITDVNGVIVYVNKKFEDVSGYNAYELVGNTHQIIKHPSTSQKVFKSLWRTITKKKSWHGLIRNKKKDGSSYFVKTVIVPILNEKEQIQQYLSIRNDVTDIMKARKTIQIQNTDILTGLPNRTRLNTEIKNNDIEQLAIFDVRNFKLLNDFWGIDFGDAVITYLSKLFTEQASLYDFKVYKFNGASFALRSLRVISINDFLLRCEELKEKLESLKIQIDNNTLDISLTVGVGVSKNRIIAITESALFDSKANYSSSVVLKTEEEQSSNDIYKCIEEVRLALKEKRVITLFQRLQPTQNKKQYIEKFEALVRIDQGNGNLLSPGMFLQHIKKTSLYGDLTRTVLSNALQTVNKLNCIISVNLSIQDILDKQTKAFIFDKLKANEVSNIIFEITESEAIKDFSSVTEFIKIVRNYGVKIAIDDFGSGYSNFSYLVDIKPDFIKIDGSIIKGVINNKSCKLVAKSIIDMAKSLDILTVAEFVSNREIYLCLMDLGVDLVQGYYISEPLFASQIAINKHDDLMKLEISQD